MTVAAAIIAGGSAERFGGRLKSHLLVDGERIIDRQLAVLRPLFADIAISANDPAPYVEFGLPILPDAASGQGPLAGLAAALQWCPGKRLFVVACDMPYLCHQVIRQLTGTAGELIIPVTEGRPQPLHAVYSQACLSAVRARLARGSRALYRLVDDVSAVRLQFDNAGSCFINVNTPEDLLESTTSSGVS